MNSCAWQLRRRFDFTLSSVRLAKRDILANRRGKESRLLQHHADLAAQ